MSTMVQDHKAIWLSPTVFTWAPFVDASTEFKQEPWKRSHALFLHAEQILNNATTDDERADAIVALRRAINSRVRLLDQRYSFRRLPIKDKPSDVLGLLAFVGLVRPRMLRKLIDIRDAIEHEDIVPPDAEACSVLLEFTWYFLKSTDFITQRVIDTITFTDEENGCWVELGINPPDRWEPRVRGWVPSRLISSEAYDSWLLLQVKRLEKRGKNADPADGGFGNESCDRFFQADVRGPAEALRELYRFYFEIV